MSRPFVAFHFSLVQDVAVLRPLALLAARLDAHDVELFVSRGFVDKDDDGKWRTEIDRLGAQLGVEPFTYESDFDVVRHIGTRRGMVIAGSESHLAAHLETHHLLRAMPAGVRTVTLQHGLECVGFLHNRRHDDSAGPDVRFAADIVVGWFDAARLTALPPAQRQKLYVAGPTILIDPPQRRPTAAQAPGLICENLHSVRFASGAMREKFLTTFMAFVARLDSVDAPVALRAHPAGRFTARNQVALPASVELSTAPIYDVGFDRFAYAISAPSTVLLDAVLAGIPAAVWVDPDSNSDIRNFDGLPTVAGLEDWWSFHWAAQWQRAALITAQDAYLAELGIPDDVAERYARLLMAA